MRAEHGELGAVRVGYILSAAYDTMPRLIRAVAKEHPDVQVVLRESWTPDLDAALQNGDFDVAISHTLPDRPEYRRRPLRRENFVAVVDINHPFAQRGSASLEEFEGQTFCFYSRANAPAHHDKLTTMLARTGKAFAFREDPASARRPPRSS
ncbi:LysR family substrate-binding domain-containing protein [Streptomyces himastatinicus]|uniref:LysR family substrate-binding domain-containing protein n=1 Tax=Streptomyces himastatinicus TaxID=998084 RepID=UPI0001B4B8B3|nr:LysR family substrate-binding domain-containing protein [Streptomyces himastatinicus]